MVGKDPSEMSGLTTHLENQTLDIEDQKESIPSKVQYHKFSIYRADVNIQFF